MKIRNGQPSDYDRVKSVMNEWWNGRQVDHLQHELFFDYFTETVFIAENPEGKMIAFINGFYLQVDSTTAYVHFIGVDPSVRGTGLGKNLYERFYQKCLTDGRTIVRSCTSKLNQESVKFHERLGFRVREDDHGKVQFEKLLSGS